MGRWGWRVIATLCVSVWVMVACGPTLPPTSSNPIITPQITPLLQTASPGGGGTAANAPPSSRTTATASSQPSRTPDAFATPQYYIVVPGDTLESIAARFGISVSALQAFNAGLPPEWVIPGQALLIPPQAMSASATGTFVRFLPTHTPLPLPVPPASCYLTPADEAICLGRVENLLSEAVQGIVVQIVLQDTAGATLTAAAAPLSQVILPPGESGTYVVRFDSPPDFDSAEVLLLSAGTIDPGESVIPLTVLDSVHELQGGQAYIRGIIRNEADAPLGDLLVAITLLDEAGQVTGFRVLHPEGTLAPGEMISIEALVAPLGMTPVQHHVYAEGRIARQ